MGVVRATAILVICARWTRAGNGRTPPCGGFRNHRATRSVPGRGSGSACEAQRHPGRTRSEEHTSELQSLMRISYAVFCLKKKKHRQDSASTHLNHPRDIIVNT